jgi:hypothetical protein
LNALSLSLSRSNHSNFSTLTNFHGFVDSEERFSAYIHEFSNARVAVSPQFSWFRKPLQREMQCESLSEGKYWLRADILKAAIGRSVSGMLSPVLCERGRDCVTHDTHAARDGLRPKKAPALVMETARAHHAGHERSCAREQDRFS